MNMKRSTLRFPVVRLAFVFLSLTGTDAFRDASWQPKFRTTPLTCPRVFRLFPRSSIPSRSLQMALDFASASHATEMILAAKDALPSSPEVQGVTDAFNSAGIQSILKEMKTISASSPISDILALITKLSNSPEFNRLIQDIQTLQRKVRRRLFSLMASIHEHSLASRCTRRTCTCPPSCLPKTPGKPRSAS